MKRAIGVFDSGIGGLSVLQALRAALPHEDFIYVADSGHAPYGERDEAHVLARSRDIAQYLVGQNVKALVVACNTATAAAVKLLRSEHPGLALIGVEPALKPAVALSTTGRIGVMATRGTLASEKFRALLAAQTAQTTQTTQTAQSSHARFVLQPCDGLADAIERSAETGDISKTIALCAQYTGAMGLFGNEPGQIDTLVLGCTHYPFASEALRALLGPDIRIVDNGEAVARQTQRLTQSGQIAPVEGSMGMKQGQEQGQVDLFSTGQPQALKAAASRWLGLSGPVHPLHI